ncbi:MAG TPA: tetratricopeptide repeat protein, partial [Planctomycetes bacterium]|nr:tetratricopeptide repeat protein [Planctomycetota bacterium]
PILPKIDRAALLDQALNQAKALGKPLLVYGFRIEGRPMYRAPLVDEYMNLAVFSDPDLAALIRRRFVALRLFVDRSVGKRLGAYNGNSADPLFLKVVEPALFLLGPKGKVLHRVQRIRSFSPTWVRSLLIAFLTRRKIGGEGALTEAASKAKSMRDRIYLAEQLSLDGRDGDALKLLKSFEKSALASSKWKEMFVKTAAAVLRRMGRLSEALKLLDAAPGLRLERMRCLIRAGEFAKAVALVEQVPLAEQDSEMLWWKGAALWRLWRTREAIAAFSRAALGDGPFAQRAAAMLARGDDTTPLSPLAHDFEILVDTRVAWKKGSPLPSTSELGEPKNLKKALPARARAGLLYLLERQRPDGSWSDTRYAYWPAPKILPNVRVAVTALAATALLRWRDRLPRGQGALSPQRIDQAVQKAQAYLSDDKRLALGTEEEVYSEAYRMLFFLERLKQGKKAEHKTLVAELERLARRAQQIQDKNSGFFAHEYKNAFCTGAMMWSLYLAKTHKIQVPEDVTQQGVKALLSARRKDGSFSYGGSAKGRRGGSISSNLKNAAGRMPLCEAVLRAFASSDDKKVAAAFRNFLAHLKELERVRKCDFHSDGQLGGFFFWHSVFHASEAASFLPPKAQKAVHRELLRLVLSIPELDGSWVDSHELGKSYGTAMALLTLSNVAR